MIQKETGEKPDDFFQVALASVAYSISQMVRKRAFDEAQWKGTYVGPYLQSFIGKPLADSISIELRKRWMEIERVRSLPHYVL